MGQAVTNGSKYAHYPDIRGYDTLEVYSGDTVRTHQPKKRPISCDGPAAQNAPQPLQYSKAVNPTP